MPILERSRIDEIVEAVRIGQVVAIPTDTVYGLAARADHPRAVQQLYELKGRDPEQPIALLFDEPRNIERRVERTPAFERLSRFWPGPLTLVTWVRPGTVAAVMTSDMGTLGVRQPDDELAREVIRKCGGVLAVTSANRSGEPPATTAEEAASIFGDRVLVLDGGERRGEASTVVDVTEEPPRILREGLLRAADLGLVGAS